jgi:hypothetical protein
MVEIIMDGKKVDLVSTDEDNPSYWIQRKNGEVISNKYQCSDSDDGGDSDFADNYEKLTNMFFDFEKAGV